ncbi:MAG: SIS domain-containing protein [Planctomycetes bacterium]|nr:SIS domain-containing protein [Planctomycetota bacterium]MBU2457452.1 SIS domain-containing protein [Planctomycetota bacterium]MBU2597502.1 SIS domain-containing protein [Planctomycetota bacterium]
MKKRISNGMKKQIVKTIAMHRKMLDSLEADGIGIVENIAKTIIKSIEKGGTLYICGNGGSAADAQHIAGEFIGRFLKNRKSLPAIALSTDSSVITSIANDYGFDDIFVKQVEGLVKKQDCLWALSTSGSSPNIIKAAKLAKKRGVKVIAFTGRKNSILEKIADVCLCAEADKTFAIQEIHQIAYHIICGLVEGHFA